MTQTNPGPVPPTLRYIKPMGPVTSTNLCSIEPGTPRDPVNTNKPPITGISMIG